MDKYEKTIAKIEERIEFFEKRIEKLCKGVVNKQCVDDYDQDLSKYFAEEILYAAHGKECLTYLLDDIKKL